MSFDDRIAAGDSRMIAIFGTSTPAVFDYINSISVIFNKESQTALDGSGDILIFGPEAICKTTDVLDPIDKTLTIEGITYFIKEYRPDNFGMTVLTLSEDE